VYEAIHRIDGTHFALKSISKLKIKKEGIETNINLEKHILTTLKHKFIVKCFGFFEDVDFMRL
jgi:serine/threonine protein kinase